MDVNPSTLRMSWVVPAVSLDTSANLEKSHVMLRIGVENFETQNKKLFNAFLLTAGQS